MEGFRFEVLARDPGSQARRGRLHTPHGVIETPSFMPVGTRATVKAIGPEQLEALGAEILLANTYHLYLRPGTETIAALGGLHGFTTWQRPFLTDSGGFQVFSLAALARVDEAGVRFRSHLDGAAHLFTPELATHAQLQLGADIIMAFDQCLGYPAAHDAAQARLAMERTLRWAERCRNTWEAAGRGSAVQRGDTAPYTQALFGIVQGGAHLDLRAECAERLAALDLPGYAIGGVSVGEPAATAAVVVAATAPRLADDKPRYLMGVGTPEDLERYVRLGVDLFDCVLPTRNARNGVLFTSQGKIAIKNARYARDPNPLDPACGCRVCRRYSRAYLRHLFQSGEVLAAMLHTEHNLFHYLDRMRQLRHAVELGERYPQRRAGRATEPDSTCP
ncbi:MAG: tRNA guanosine(34) transglycosylase Tgt [Terriglobales bacterium]